MPGEGDQFEVYRDKRNNYRWRRIAPNGRVVGAATRGFERRRDCEANMTRGPVESDEWTFFRDRKGEWRWRRVAANGVVVGASCEGYARRPDAVTNAERNGYRG